MRALILAALLALGCGGTAGAHDWYPASCCSGVDCAPVRPSSVQETASGYVVAVQPGTHPMWRADRPRPLVVRIPYREAKASPDGQWHLCINGSGDLLCFFAIVGGS